MAEQTFWEVIGALLVVILLIILIFAFRGQIWAAIGGPTQFANDTARIFNEVFNSSVVKDDMNPDEKIVKKNFEYVTKEFISFSESDNKECWEFIPTYISSGLKTNEDYSIVFSDLGNGKSVAYAYQGKYQEGGLPDSALIIQVTLPYQFCYHPENMKKTEVGRTFTLAKAEGYEDGFIVFKVNEDKACFMDNSFIGKYTNCGASSRDDLQKEECLTTVNSCEDYGKDKEKCEANLCDFEEKCFYDGNDCRSLDCSKVSNCEDYASDKFLMNLWGTLCEKDLCNKGPCEIGSEPALPTGAKETCNKK